jgi:VIT1/CCC1 family predicted Fe2+/Mn2+ transporter
MASGAYLSTKCEHEYYLREYEREMWEVKNFPEGERAELRELYESRGYSPEEARQLVDVHSREPERWVRAMMVEELGMLPDERQPLSSGLATFLAFVVAGSLPLLVYLLGLFTPIAPGVSLPASVALAGVALFGLGAARVFVTERRPLRSGLEMLSIGGLAAAVAYLVGAFLRGIVG